MPRYLVERRFRDGWEIASTPDGATRCKAIAERNGDLAVTWLHSYVSDDEGTSYCVYEGPNAELIRKAAERNGLPVERITKVTVFDPYFHH